MRRRDFLQKTSALGAASLLSFSSASRAEPPPETRRIRLLATPAICVAPEFVAEPFLKAEGFTDIEYVKYDVTVNTQITLNTASVDIMSLPPGNILMGIEAGDPITVLSGEHLGCYELFGTERVRAISDIRGKRIPIDNFGGPQHVFISTMAAYVGVDPRTDIDWIVKPSAEGMRMFVDGKVDAFLGFPPEPQELRARKVGHVIVNTSADRPWSQYYCCMLIGHHDFVRKYPIATKRALRAILKAADLCVEQPEQAARIMVEKGFAKNYGYALETVKEVSYGAWRAYDPENTLRFHALRLHEVGMINTAPQTLISRAADWRFLRELRRELKA